MEWVERGSGLDGFFGETGDASWHPGAFERFHREFVDYHNRQFVPKWGSHSDGLDVGSMGN